MPKKDFRQQSPEAQTKLRRRAIAMQRQNTTPIEISRQLGVSLASVYNWRRRHLEGGDKALISKPRRGAPKKVDDARLAPLAAKLTRTCPNHHGYSRGLWTNALIGSELKKHHKLQLSRWTPARLRRKLGLLLNHPDQTKWFRQQEAISNWVKSLTCRTKRVSTDQPVRIYLADVSPIDASSPIGQAWSSNNSPGTETSGCCIWSAVEPRGDVHFRVVRHAPTDNDFREFIHQLMIGQSGVVVLVVKNGHFQSDVIALECLRKFAGNLRLFRVADFESGEVPSEILS